MNQLIIANLKKINDSSNFCALYQLLSWDRHYTDAAASTVSTRTSFVYVPSIHTAHTPSLVHSLYLYPLVPPRHTFTNSTGEPPSTLYGSSAENVTPKVNTTSLNNLPNSLLNIPAVPYSDASLSGSPSPDSSD